MDFWDLGLRDTSGETLDMAGKLGWKGIGLLVPWEGKENLEKFRKSLGKAKVDVSVGVIIGAKKASGMKKDVLKARPLAELVAVSGGDLEINRAALERPEVDILLNPWKDRNDPGLDYVMARLGRKNRVSVMFGFNELLVSSKRGRVRVMSNLLAAAKLVRKHKAPFVLSSGAKGTFDLLAPSDSMSFGRVLGFRDPEIKRGLSGQMVRENRKRLSGKWVMPGVEIE